MKLQLHSEVPPMSAAVIPSAHHDWPVDNDCYYSFFSPSLFSGCVLFMWLAVKRKDKNFFFLYGQIKWFLTCFNNKAPHFFLPKAQRWETAGCNIKAWSYSLNLQNLSHRKQAGRENGISAAVQRDEERREKKVELCKRSFVRALFPPSLAVRPQKQLKRRRGICILDSEPSLSLPPEITCGLPWM